MESIASKHRHVKCTSLALDSVRVDAGTQARAGLDEGAVAEYAEAIGRGVEFPPVVVFRDGSAHFLADGFHRLAAFRQAGRESIEAEVRDGTREDARWYAIGANAAHGLRRSNADKAKAVRMALRARPNLSDRAIADHVGVSNTFVGKCRSELENGGLLSTVDSRTSKRGRRRAARKSSGKPVDPDAIPMGDEAPGVASAHRAAEGSLAAALDHAREAGQLLAEAKAQLTHGTWLPWLEQNFAGTVEEAEGYIRLAEAQPDGEIDVKTARLALAG